MQNLLIFRIAEVHMVKNYISLHRLIGCRIVCLMIMLPRPHPGSVRNFRQISLFIIVCVYQLYISAVLFRLLIQQPKNPLRTRDCHDDRIQLL